MALIEQLNETIQFPLPRPEEKWTYEFQRRFNGELERILGEETNVTVNLLLGQGGNTAIYYYGVADSAGTYANLIWRVLTDSDECTIQQLIAGTWTTVGSFAPDGTLTITNLVLSGTLIVPDILLSDIGLTAVETFRYNFMMSSH